MPPAPSALLGREEQRRAKLLKQKVVAQDVQAAIAQAQGRLPDDMPRAAHQPAPPPPPAEVTQ